MLKVLVADDERIARQVIMLLLQDQPDIGDIRQACDGKQTIEVLEEYQPDIVFLDVQMPGSTGLQVAEQLQHHSALIFVTAYNEYAVQAFELNALDYLLKPFDDERFYSALQRARRHLREQRSIDMQGVGTLMEQVVKERHREFKSRLVIKEQGRIRFVPVADMNFIAGAGNYAEVHLFNGDIVLHRETLTTLEKQLDPEEFVRIHRSTIVRRSQISELRPSIKGDYTVLLKSGEKLTLSRSNKPKLAEFIGFR